MNYTEADENDEWENVGFIQDISFRMPGIGNRNQE